MDWTLELATVPVSDMDRAKAFYIDQMGFTLDVDHSAGEDFRVIQLTPPGSACSIALLRMTDPPPGTAAGLHLVVADIEAARAELVARGAPVGDYFHFTDGGETKGLHPDRGDYETFLHLQDPDGNRWLVQEVSRGRRA
jgi:catechol 2,3-dioxygenase-like lactoylglutathione lyase family enzyme